MTNKPRRRRASTKPEAKSFKFDAFITPPAALEVLLPWAVCLAGLAALLGHARSIWLNFTGGKSVAAGLGVLLAMSWPVGAGAFALFGVALAISRIVSLSSILAALTAIALVCVLDQPLPYRLLVIAGGVYVIVRHRANIQRLLKGTEPRAATVKVTDWPAAAVWSSGCRVMWASGRLALAVKLTRWTEPVFGLN